MSKLVQNYLLQQPIGKGVYGQVYRAIHQKSKLPFAVKVIPKSSFRSNPKLQQLAINQINILSSLKHQNIVKFVQTLKTPNNFYFVYQYCNQGTIEDLIQKKGYLKETEALVVFRQLLQAFKQLNKNNIMHRDLKPDNIFMSNGKVKLGDFGFCKMLEVNMAQTMLGSPIYMAPQILKQQIYTSKADIWSLGVVLFELLFGYCPYQSSSISQLINVITQNDLLIPYQTNPISQKVSTLLHKMLVKDQFKRIQWVDLFQFKIDQNGNVIEGYNKEMGIQALQKYFLYDVKSNGDIPFIDELNKDDNKTNSNQQFRSQEIDSEKHMYKKNNTTNQQLHAPPSLKKIMSSNSNKGKTNDILRSQNLGKASPSPNSAYQEIKQFSLAPTSTSTFYAKPAQVLPMAIQRSSSSSTPKQSPFLQFHTNWSSGITLISQLSQRNANISAQTQKLIYFIAKSLAQKLSSQSLNYPQWTDVIMQEKEQLSLILKHFQHFQHIRNFDTKNQVLKIWTKANAKGDHLWEQAVKFIFNQQQSAYRNRTTQEILLS